jgi:hypothetical protein
VATASARSRESLGRFGGLALARVDGGFRAGTRTREAIAHRVVGRLFRGPGVGQARQFRANGGGVGERLQPIGRVA